MTLSNILIANNINIPYLLVLKNIINIKGINDHICTYTYTKYEPGPTPPKLKPLKIGFYLIIKLLLIEQYRQV